MPDLNNLCDRVSKTEFVQDEHRRKIDEIFTALQENTVLTKQGITLAQRSLDATQATASNTAELVELSKGAKYIWRFVLWLAVPIVGIVYFYEHILDKFK